MSRSRAVLALGRAVATAATVLLGSLSAASAQEPKPPYLELVQIISNNFGMEPAGWTKLNPGHITRDRNGTTSDHTWSELPEFADGNGFTVHLEAEGSVEAGKFGTTVGTEILTTFRIDYDPMLGRGPSFRVEGGQSGSQSGDVHLTPFSDLQPGGQVEIWIAPTNGPGYAYIYKVADGPPTGPAMVTTNLGTLDAQVECPMGPIFISRLPSLNCHIEISGFERNTATPVEVILPDAIDQFGNHENGIQVDGDGQEDVFDWGDTYSWGLFVFACPAEDNVAANCFDSVTTADFKEVPIIVKQGDNAVRLTLFINAMEDGPNMPRTAPPAKVAPTKPKP